MYTATISVSFKETSNELLPLLQLLAERIAHTITGEQKGSSLLVNIQRRLPTGKIGEVQTAARPPRGKWTAENLYGHAPDHRKLKP